MSRPGTRVCHVLFVAIVVLTGPVAAQTLSQNLDLGDDVGARLTRGYARQKWNKSLYFEPSAVAGYIDATAGMAMYQFSPDRAWQRLVFSRRGSWTNVFSNEGLPGGRLRHPMDVDISANMMLYIADTFNHRILVTSFNGTALATMGSFTASPFFPVAVAWDGGGKPFEGDSLYTLDGAQGSVSYWKPVGGTWSSLWTYGSRGSGVGQFLNPTGICVGHYASSASGSSNFTMDFYVADAGNHRIVWLQRRNTGAPLWRGTRTLAEGWDPADCTVDHFGNVYVADRQNSQIVKYTKNLIELDRYGSYGTGATNYNTFSHPHSVHVPFGKKVVGGTTIWYGEGRILTAEDWGAGTGGLEHFLGVDIPWATAGGGFAPHADFFLTEHSLLTVEVFNKLGQLKRTIYAGTLVPSSVHSAYWDGLTNAGTPAPDGRYRFKITARSPYCSGPTYCQSTRYTNFFQHTECVDPESIECNPPEPRNVALIAVEGVTIAHLPSTYRLGQAITTYEGPLFRLDGVGAASAAAPLSGGDAVASVRAHGIRALVIDVPARAEATPVQIRIYDLSGRLVRVLVDETVDPGRYLVGWDGADASGRAVRPGVYVAMMSAGSFHGRQRLILK